MTYINFKKGGSGEWRLTEWDNRRVTQNAYISISTECVYTLENNYAEGWKVSLKC
jgi:hypothetical protein